MIPHVSAVVQDLHIDQTHWAFWRAMFKNAPVDRYPNSCISKLAIYIYYISYHIYIYTYIYTYIYIIYIVYIYTYTDHDKFSRCCHDPMRFPINDVATGFRARPRSIFHPPQPVAPARIDPGGRWRLSTIVQYTYVYIYSMYICIYVYVCGNIYIYIHSVLYNSL